MLKTLHFFHRGKYVENLLLHFFHQGKYVQNPTFFFAMCAGGKYVENLARGEGRWVWARVVGGAACVWRVAKGAGSVLASLAALLLYIYISLVWYLH